MTMPTAKKVENFSPSETLIKAKAGLQSFQNLVYSRSQGMRPDRNSDAATTARAVCSQQDSAQIFFSHATEVGTEYAWLIEKLMLNEEDLANKKKNGFFRYVFNERFIYDAGYLKTEEELLLRAIQLTNEIIADPTKMTMPEYTEQYEALLKDVQNQITKHESDRVTNQQKLRRLKWTTGLLAVLLLAAYVTFLALLALPSFGVLPIVLGCAAGVAGMSVVPGSVAYCNLNKNTTLRDSFQHADRLKTVVTSEKFKNTFFDSKKSPLLRQLDGAAMTTTPAPTSM